MANAKKESDGPEPYSSSAFDFTLLPDYNDDFINEDDFDEFARALAAPEHRSPSSEDLTAQQPEPRTYFSALNDWRPIHQRVRRRKKSKAPPRRGKDETREGFVYILLKWPLLIVVLGWLLFLSIAYVITRLYIYMYEHMVTWRGTRQKLRKRLQSASSYEDWIKGAKELDTHLGSDDWKKNPNYVNAPNPTSPASRTRTKRTARLALLKISARYWKLASRTTSAASRTPDYTARHTMAPRTLFRTLSRRLKRHWLSF
jgi:hypothetical protein